MRRLLLLLIVLGVAGFAGSCAYADDEDKGHFSGGDNSHHDSRPFPTGDGKDVIPATDVSDGYDGARIRRAVSEGKAQPLRNILETLHDRFQGEVVRIRLDSQANKLIYFIRIIDSSNQLFEVQVNASTGKIVGPAGLY
jgi:hypothetical protein